jgi:hypothetical protein
VTRLHAALSRAIPATVVLLKPISAAISPSDLPTSVAKLAQSKAPARILEATQSVNLDIHYDPAAGALYCSFGPPQEAIGEEVSNGIVVRRNPTTNATVGFTVVDFSKRFAAYPAKTVSVPLPLPAEAVI